jgi:hypothetical protein
MFNKSSTNESKKPFDNNNKQKTEWIWYCNIILLFLVE